MIKSVVWSSMIDYPEQISTVLFVGICNWKCEFCHNIKLSNESVIDFNMILQKLIQRKKLINHIVISGGECTCWNELSNIIKVLKENDFKIGIHTNGSNHNWLEQNIKDIDFIGMDIKTSFEKYNDITQVKVNKKELIKSIKLIINSNKQYEFRTTLYPKYVNQYDCINITKFLFEKNVKEYVLQQFDNSNIEDCHVIPYSNNEIQNILTECNKIIPTKLRS